MTEQEGGKIAGFLFLDKVIFYEWNMSDITKKIRNHFSDYSGPISAYAHKFKIQKEYMLHI